MPNAEFPILRVFASWEGDANLDRSMAKTEQMKKNKAKDPAGNEDLAGEKKTPSCDVDSHPLATLHLENFNRISKEMDVNWFRGIVEQNEVIHLKRSASVELDTHMQKRAKQQVADDEMVGVL